MKYERETNVIALEILIGKQGVYPTALLGSNRGVQGATVFWHQGQTSITWKGFTRLKVER